jgi:hypothetical protein
MLIQHKDQDQDLAYYKCQMALFGLHGNILQQNQLVLVFQNTNQSHCTRQHKKNPLRQHHKTIL